MGYESEQVRELGKVKAFEWVEQKNIYSQQRQRQESVFA